MRPDSFDLSRKAASYTDATARLGTHAMAVEGHAEFGPQLRETLARITEEAAHLLAAEGAGLRLVEGGELVRVATYGPEGAVMARERLRIGESLSGRVAESGEPLILADSQADPTNDPVYR